VPTISRFFGIAIAMFYDDHGFPHFHARHADGEAKVRIDNLEVIDSRSAVGNSDWCWPGPSFIRRSLRRTGSEPGPVRHWPRSSRCDDRPHP
jgi:hypothetical protein